MKDIYMKDFLASKVICDGKILSNYSKVFYKTNEDLIDAYLDVDFYDKKVLSVMASGDQVLTARYLDAREVDSFDINRLTLYYFYLRLWSIKYNNELYPNIFDNNTWLKELIKKVEVNSELEEKVLKFYKLHQEYNTNLENLFFDIDIQNKGRTLYTESKELEDCLSSDINFDSFNLFERNSFNKKYNIALISNILEWANGDSKKLDIACENLDSLLDDDGVVVCTNLITRSQKNLNTEKEIFNNCFKQEKYGKNYIYKRK